MNRAAAFASHVNGGKGGGAGGKGGGAGSGAPLETHVKCDVDGHVGFIRLTRPSKFNALTLGMIRDLHGVYDQWMGPGGPSVKCVVLEGEGIGFCAGGDVAAVRAAAIQGPPQIDGLPVDFFHEEYQLNDKLAHMLEHHGVPQITVWKGPSMGGGIGLSVHGRFRVATETCVFAKPETAIGLFPDVGGTFALARIRGGVPVGLFIGLTGQRLGAADCMYAGLATHYVPMIQLDALRAALVDLGAAANEVDTVDRTITTIGSGHMPPQDKAILQKHEACIQACFSAPSVEGIIERLAAEASGGGPSAEWAAGTAKKIGSMSPTSVKVTFEAITRHARPSCTISEALSTEYRISQRCVRRPQPLSDFHEGVRAVLVDKKPKSAKYQPATLEGVSEEAVREFFAPLPPSHPRGELCFSVFGVV